MKAVFELLYTRYVDENFDNFKERLERQDERTLREIYNRYRLSEDDDIEVQLEKVLTRAVISAIFQERLWKTEGLQQD